MSTSPFDRIVCLTFDKRMTETTIASEFQHYFGWPVETFLCGDGILYPHHLYDYVDCQVVGRAQAWNYGRCLQKILWQSWKANHRNVLFLEDDAIVNTNISTPDYYLLSGWNTIQHYDWDMFYLGGNIQNGINETTSSPNLIKSNYILDMQATVFNRTSFKTILEIEPSNQVTIDGVIGEKQKHGLLKAFTLSPVLITQKPNFSYNEMKMVDRAKNHILK